MERRFHARARRRRLPGAHFREAEVEIIDQLPLQVMPADRLLVFDAAHVKARHRVAYADAFSVALARRHGGRVMTGDPEFKAVESEITVHWLPDRRRRPPAKT